MNQKLQKTKKWLSIVLVAVMLLTCAPLAGFVGLPMNGIDFALPAFAEEVPTSGTWGENLTWRVDGDVLTVSGEGDMQDTDMDSDIFPEWFYHYQTVRSIVIEDGITGIGAYSFVQFTALSQVSIPDSVTGIGIYAFALSALSQITIPGSVTKIGEYAFLQCENLADVTIENGVTGIGGGAFYGCTSLTGITVPDSVTSIESYAFYNCTTLANVSFGDGVTSIGYNAFAGCSALADITLPEGITSIHASAFNNTAYYKDESNWEDGVLYIDGYLIRVNTSLAGAYTVKEGTTLIASYAFGDCTSLTAVTIPDSVTAIGERAFDYCTKLTGVTFGENSKLTTIDKNAFCYCYSLTDINLPDSLTAINSLTFQSCTALESITIPKNVTSVAYDAFKNSGVTEIIVDADNTALTAEDGVLYNKTKTVVYLSLPRTSFTADAAVAALGERAFYYSDIEKVIILNPDCEMGDACIPASAVIFGYADSTAQAYAQANGNTFHVWGGTGEIPSDAIAFGTHGDNIYWVLTADGVLTVSGTGAMMEDDLPAWLEYAPDIKTAVVEDGITSIGNYAFAYCSALESVSIPDGVTRIGMMAFANCTSLTGIALHDSVTNIDICAFYGCAALTEITLPDTVTCLGESAFAYCTSLTEIAIPNGVTSIEGSLFAYCEALTEISIPASVTLITLNAFDECPDLVSINVDENNEYYSDYEGVLYNKDKTVLLRHPQGKKDDSFVFLPTVTTIGENAFYGCAVRTTTVKQTVQGYGTFYMYYLNVPYTVTSVGANAFDSIVTPGGNNYFYYIEFYNPNCEIYDSADTIKSSQYLAIGGYEDSTAQTYATKYNRTFASLGAMPEDHTPAAQLKENEVAATCETEGSYDLVVYCADEGCNKELHRATIKVPALGHVFGDYVQTVAPDCENPGKKVASCKRNGCDAIDEKEILALGHSFTTYEPSAAKPGMEVAYCDNGCGATDEREVAGHEHTPSAAVKENEVAATCEEDGSYDLVVYCDVCGVELSRETVTEDALGHSFTKYEQTVAPTCEETGKEVAVCDNGCKTENERAVAALGHSFTQYEQTVAPDCENEGKEVAVCDNGCKTENERAVAALGHTPLEAVKENIVGADCVTEGSYDLVVYCDVCGDELERTAVTGEALGHTPLNAVKENEVAATCEEDGSYDLVVYCDVCGDELERETVTVDALGHSFTKYEQTVAPACEETGKEVAVCDNGCKTENERAVAALGHSFTKYEQTVAPDCENEGKEVAVCDNGCKTENERAVPALGHTPLNAVKENEVAATCEEDGSYDLVVYCDVCGDELERETVTVDALGHSFTKYEQTVAPDCENEGKEVAVCDNGCKTENERAVAALGHSFTQYEQTEAPDCENEGKEVAVCDNGCGETDERVVPALGHLFTKYTSNNDATCEKDGTKTAVCDRGCRVRKVVTDKGSKLAHVDEDGDEICDVCGNTVYISVEDCTCTCHRDDPFNRFVYKIIQFLRNLFGINSSCDCGTVHTEGLKPFWKIF